MFISPNHASEWHPESEAANYHGAMTNEFGAHIDAMLGGACSWLDHDRDELAKLMCQIEDWRVRVASAKHEHNVVSLRAVVDADES